LPAGTLQTQQDFSEKEKNVCVCRRIVRKQYHLYFFTSFIPLCEIRSFSNLFNMLKGMKKGRRLCFLGFYVFVSFRKLSFSPMPRYVNNIGCIGYYWVS